MFVAFYSKMNPKVFQADSQKLLDYQLLGLPWVDQLEEYRVGKYTFKQIEWDGGSEGPRTLYIGKGDDFWEDTRVRRTIYFPDGSIAFRLVNGY